MAGRGDVGKQQAAARRDPTCRRAAAAAAAAHGWLHARDRCRGCPGADPAGARRFWPAWAAALPAQPSFGLGDPTADLWINQGYVSG